LTDGGPSADTFSTPDTRRSTEPIPVPADASGLCPAEPLSAIRIDAKDTCGGTVDAGVNGEVVMRLCFPLPTDGGTCASAYSETCVVSRYACGLSNRGDSVACGPLPTRSEACCYDVLGGCPVGRPFTVHGRARRAPLSGDDAWTSAMDPDLDGLDAATRASLAAAWAEEGQTEHASVASFSRLALELLSLGAPPALVRDTLTAALDEERHAMAAFGLARAYGGGALGPGPLDVRSSLDDTSAASIAARLASEGCVAETVSAVLVAEASAEATCRVVKAHLARVAEEEARHAALAWRQLAWLLGRGGAEPHARVREVFAHADQHVGLGVTARTADAAALRRHGQLPASEKRAIARRVLAEVVLEAAQALLREPTPARRAPSPAA